MPAWLTWVLKQFLPEVIRQLRVNCSLRAAVQFLIDQDQRFFLPILS